MKIKKKKEKRKVSFENSEKSNDAEIFEFMTESFKALNISVGDNYAQK
jgi:hypothetical protein